MESVLEVERVLEGLSLLPNDRIYRDIGLTTKYSDYRGSRNFDWGHSAAFAEPGGITAHVPW